MTVSLWFFLIHMERDSVTSWEQIRPTNIYWCVLSVILLQMGEQTYILEWKSHLKSWRTVNIRIQSPPSFSSQMDRILMQMKESRRAWQIWFQTSVSQFTPLALVTTMMLNWWSSYANWKMETSILLTRLIRWTNFSLTLSVDSSRLLHRKFKSISQSIFINQTQNSSMLPVSQRHMAWCGTSSKRINSFASR